MWITFISTSATVICVKIICFVCSERTKSYEVDIVFQLTKLHVTILA